MGEGNVKSAQSEKWSVFNNIEVYHAVTQLILSPSLMETALLCGKVRLLTFKASKLQHFTENDMFL